MPSTMLTVEEALARSYYYFIPWKPLTGSVAKGEQGLLLPMAVGTAYTLIGNSFAEHRT